MKNKTIDELKNLAEVIKTPDGKEHTKISLLSLKNFAEKYNFKIKEAEIFALENGILPQRYQRNIGSIGLLGQVKLLKSKVAIIGLGGLGGMIIELLARAGIGQMVIVDGDVFEESNLNRQILCHENNLGFSKTEVAVKRIKSINRGIDVTAYSTPIKEDNVFDIIKDADLAIDALDNIPSRLHLENATKKIGIPLIHGAVAGLFGQVLTIFPKDKGLEGIYGFPDNSPGSGIETELGTLSTTPAMIASWQVQEAIKIILGEGKLLRNRLLCIDGQGGKVETIFLGEKK